jgi:cytidyltransferase-like protein
LIENIRYVKKVIIVDSINDSILSNYAHQAGGQMISWAVREQGVSGQNSSFFTRNGIKFITIPDERLKGFPIEDTPPISPSIKKVMVSGCFDWLHSGHVRFFEEASRFGKLFVVIGHDENLQLLKGEGHPLFPQDQRRYWVQSIRFVHTTLISSGHGWLDAQPEMERYKPDIFIVNHDGDKPEKRELCKSLGIKYRILARTPKPGLQARVSTNLRGF